MTTHGIVLLDKPLGMSSNSATQRVRRLLAAKSAGHIGSLDPLASGMLPICLNEATKVISEILPGRKHYRFTVTLGARTATGDAEGEVVERSPVPPLDAAGVSAALAKFVGVHQQVPPMYSALKRAGEPLYRIARRGETVERAAREIVIHQAKLLALAPQTIECDLLCGKGTYVRVLAEDLARALGTCGFVSVLRRISVAPFERCAMQTLDSLESGAVLNLMAPDAALPQLAAVQLDAEATRRLRLGQDVAYSQQGAAFEGAGATLALGDSLRIYDADRVFLGLGRASAAGRVQPRRLLIL